MSVKQWLKLRRIDQKLKAARSHIYADALDARAVLALDDVPALVAFIQELEEYRANSDHRCEAHVPLLDVEANDAGCAVCHRVRISDLEQECESLRSTLAWIRQASRDVNTKPNLYQAVHRGLAGQLHDHGRVWTDSSTVKRVVGSVICTLDAMLAKSVGPRVAEDIAELSLAHRRLRGKTKHLELSQKHVARLTDLLRRVHAHTPHSETDLWNEVHDAIERPERED